MNFLREALLLALLLLLNCKLGDCYAIRCKGELRVDQSIVSIGSNLTVHCQSYTVQCNRLFIIKLNDHEVMRKNDCSRVTAQIVVRQPSFSLRCVVKDGGMEILVCGRDILAYQIPSTPQIKAIEFAKSSLSPTIYWQSLDDAEFLKPTLRFRRISDNSDWIEGNVTQLHGGKLVLLEDLEPMTSYGFMLRVCTVSLEYNCSLWSQLFKQSSPGKAPAHKLDAWRVITRSKGSTTQNVTVMWKALSKKDYTGKLLHYELMYQENGTTHILINSAAVTQCTLQLPLEVTKLTISAITSEGDSPPASVSLNQIGKPSPDMYIKQAKGGRIHLEWNSSYTSSDTEGILGYVVQWQCSPFNVRWKRVKTDYNSTFIPCTTPSTLYNILLYVESTDGVSEPAFGQIQNHLPIIKTDAWAKPTAVAVAVSRSVADRPEGQTLVFICIIAAVSIIVFANVMYLKCIRQRIRKMCVSVGLSWLFVNLPKLGNSNAIKLLKDENYGSDLCWQPVDSDPPLSPVEDCTPIVERKNSYPTVHTDVITEETEVVQNFTVCPYKPQNSAVSQRADALNEAVEEDEDEHPWLVFTSSVFKFEGDFLPSQGIHAPLNSCLTLDGRSVSLDVVDGFPFLNQTVLD